MANFTRQKSDFSFIQTALNLTGAHLTKLFLPLNSPFELPLLQGFPLTFRLFQKGQNLEKYLELV